MKRRLLTLALSILMIVSMIPFAAFAADGRADGWYSAYVSKAPNALSDGLQKILDKNAVKTAAGSSKYAASDVVRVSIVLEGLPTIDKYGASGIASNKAAASYRAKLKTEQDSAAKRISTFALGGKKLDVVWNLTLAVNIISANVEYGKIEKIEKVPGVKSVVIEKQYNPEATVPGYGSADPKMIVGAEMTNTYSVWANGYTGAGSSVAIIDTGIDVDHLSFDAGAFEYALGTLGEQVDILTAGDVEAVLDQLNVKINDPSLTVDDLYLNAKIPFAYNYVDQSTDVTHVNDTEGNHGSHVAGIAAANRFLPDGNGGYTEALSTVYTQGQAPDAQILAMKVFGVNGGSYDSDYFAAVEDSIILGAAAANLSLGTATAGLTTDSYYQGVFDKLEASDTLMVSSAGNNSYWAEATNATYLYAADKNFDTVGDPASLDSSLAVASVDNSGIVSPTIKFLGESIFYSETDDVGREPLQSLDGEYEFIAIDGVGTEEEFAAVGDALQGKIALCWRGELYFSEKANNAMKYGAAAIIICNHKTDKISMNLDDYEYSNPAVIISLEDANFIFSNADAVTDPETGDVLYYTGKFTMPEGVEVSDPDVDYYKLSDFSSWGVPGSLTLKPEITAPGGSIYSVNGEYQDEDGYILGESNDKYMLNSGTSMASPQIAGIAALIGEYIRENDLVAKTGLTVRQLTTSLLMATAQPLIEEDSGSYYSVLAQGAGLVDAEAALHTNTVVTMHENATDSYADGKVKAEIGVVSRDDPSFGFGFDLNNIGNEDVTYFLDAAWFTQYYFEDLAYDYEGNAIFDELDSPVTDIYMDTWTTDLAAYVVWSVNGEPVAREEDALYDFDGDGLFTYYDALVLYSYLLGETASVNCAENVDVNVDGEITIDDVYYLLGALYQVTINVPAGEKASVSVYVELLDIDEYDYYGAYVEGYVFATEYYEADGAYGMTSSIPVIGYYGDWSEPSMFDYGSVIEYYHDISTPTPYMAYELGEDALLSKYFEIDYQGIGVKLAIGNPFITDEEYIPERNAINPNDAINAAGFTLIRNSAATEVVVTDEDGNELFNYDYGSLYSAYYNSDDQEWTGYDYYLRFGYSPKDVEEGTVITAAVRTAPEYYVGEDGEVDWNSLADGTRYSQQFTVDGTDPEIISVDYHYNEELGGYDSVRVKAKDNQYIALVLLEDEEGNELGSIGSDPDVGAVPGSEYEVVFDLTEVFEDLSEVPAHMLVTVGDYAANWTEYYINLNTEELEEPYEMSAVAESVTVPLNASVELDVTVRPWGKPFTLVCTSENEEVATVNDKALVTGVAVGTTVIKVALAEDPDVFVTFEVTVKEKQKALGGLLWDENAHTWFVSFDSSDLSVYEKNTEDSTDLNMISFFYDENGNAFAASFDSGSWSSHLFSVDKETYEVTYIGTSDVGYTDIAAAPGVSEQIGKNVFAGTYLYYLLWINSDTGVSEYYYDLSEITLNDYLVGVAYAGSYYDEEHGIVDEYYLIDQAGYLYYAAFEVFENEEGILDVDMIYYFDFGKYANPVDVPYNQSLYFDTEGDLIYSRSNTNENATQLLCFELNEEEGIITYPLGWFDMKIWPVGGIHEKDAAIAFDYQTSIYGDEPVWSWSDDFKTATAKFVGPTGAEMTADAEITSKASEPDCENAETVVYTATVVIGTKTYTNEKSEALGEALGHDWGEWKVVKPATSTEEGLEQRVCSRDPSHVETRLIPKLGITFGDVNGDGKLNAKDVIAIMKHLVGKTPAGFILDAADFNGDSKLNAKDVIALMKYIVNNTNA